jgi:hypothetical protein
VSDPQKAPGPILDFLYYPLWNLMLLRLILKRAPGPILNISTTYLRTSHCSNFNQTKAEEELWKAKAEKVRRQKSVDQDQRPLERERARRSHYRGSFRRDHLRHRIMGCFLGRRIFGMTNVTGKLHGQVNPRQLSTPGPVTAQRCTAQLSSCPIKD